MISPATNLQNLPDGLISRLALHGTLILTTTLIILFLLTRALSDYILPTLYPHTLPRLPPVSLRKFTNHHGLIAAKLCILAVGARPYSALIIGPSDFSARAYAASAATLGDLTVVATAIFIAMYLHELVYWSSGAACVAVVHHVGAVVVAGVTVSLNVRWRDEEGTTAYMLLGMTYAMFDVLAGLWPRPALILRTALPSHHRVNMYACAAAAVLTVMGSVAETVFALYLYGTYFRAWSARVRYVTPVLHVLFVVAQLNSSWIMWTLFVRHRRALGRERESEKEGRGAGEGEGKCSEDDVVVPLVRVSMVDLHCVGCEGRRRSVRDWGC